MQNIKFINLERKFKAKHTLSLARRIYIWDEFF